MFCTTTITCHRVTKSVPPSTVNLNTKKPKAGTSLSAILGPKKKMSVVQKSTLDWSNYKNQEGLHEELGEHLKSKDRYFNSSTAH